MPIYLNFEAPREAQRAAFFTGRDVAVSYKSQYLKIESSKTIIKNLITEEPPVPIFLSAARIFSRYFFGANRTRILGAAPTQNSLIKISLFIFGVARFTSS